MFIALLAFLTLGAFAYNPPYGADRIFSLSSPELLSGGGSTAGGAIFRIRPSSIIDNPAITALEQRVTLDLGGTFLHDGDTEDENGFACEAGILVPTKWGSWTLLGEGIYSPIQELQLGKSINMKANFAKDLTDNLCVGINIGGGGFWGYDSDFSALVDVGAVFLLGDIGFLHQIRFAGVLLNIGKTYTDTTVLGIDWDEASSFPGFGTPKGGASALFVDTDDFKLGLSADVSFPFYQNCVFDTGLQLQFADMVTLGSSWTHNVREHDKHADINWPSAYIGVKFGISSKKAKKYNEDWAQSELGLSTAWQKINGQVHAISAGTVINLGLKDTSAPEIELWNSEE